MEKLIKKWKEYNIDRAEFEFVASGDSMGDTELLFYDKDNNTIEVDFAQEIENEIYNNVTFYEVSDGHYEGEAGTVTVTLIEEEKPFFQFDKDAQSEYRNRYTDQISIELTEEEYNYLKENVEDIVECWRNDVEYIYKKDFFLSQEKLNLENSIKNKILEVCKDHEFENDGDIEEMDGCDVSNLTFKENNKIVLNYGYIIREYEPSDQ